MSSVVTAEIVASVISVEVAVGDRVKVGDTLVLLDSMKMEIPVNSEVDGVITEVTVEVGDTVRDGDPMVVIGKP